MCDPVQVSNLSVGLEAHHVQRHNGGVLGRLLLVGLVLGGVGIPVAVKRNNRQ
jgi:hypothetical protein